MSQNNNALLKSIVVSIGVGVALYIVVLAFSGFDEAVSAASHLSLYDWSVILGLYLLSTVLRFYRWHWYLNLLGHKVSLARSFICYTAGFALTATPGKVGENIRSVYLKADGVTYTHSLAAFFAERFTDLLAVATLSTLALLQFQGYVWPIVGAGVLIFLALLLVRAPQLPLLLDRMQSSIEHPRLQSGLGHLATILRASSTLLRLGTLLASYLLALVAWGTPCLILYFVLMAMGLPADMVASVGIFSLALLAGALSFIPGGLGSTEAAMILLLAAGGIGASDATAATLVCRVATLWFAVAMGSAALAAVEFGRRQPRSA